jgi:hypothetical protein
LSEINATDQRPRTTTAEIPEKLRARKPLPKDPDLEAFKARLLEKLARRMAERRQG